MTGEISPILELTKVQRAKKYELTNEKVRVDPVRVGKGTS